MALGCVYKDVECDDYNACTQDFCDPHSGCSYVTNECLCNDDNECTTDSCDPEIGCINFVIDCNDHDDSTYDFCDAAAGCLHQIQKEGY
jgi:hypothetical protein